MAAQEWRSYDKLPDWLSDGEINFATDTMTVRLYSSASNAATLTIVDATAITNELATANGYTAGGDAVTPTWTETSAGVWTLDSDDPTWTASGGSITARFAVLVDTTPTTDRPICYCLLDTTPADVTATTGNPFTIQLATTGYIQIKRTGL